MPNVCTYIAPIRTFLALLCCWFALARAFAAEPVHLVAEGWDYAPAMQRVAAEFAGRPGVVLHVGDSITYANPYGQWARRGEGHTDSDRAILEWMHAGTDDDRDGWWLCGFDCPSGGRSYTAAGGLRADQLLAGDHPSGLPPLQAMLVDYRPQMIVLMIGTNDSAGGRPLEEFLRDVATAVDLTLQHHAICILSTIPPLYLQPELAVAYNEGLRELAREKELPLLDFEREILLRRPEDWNGTLLGHNDAHPTAERAGVAPTSPPTSENLRECGYLLRGWLSVQKIAEVKLRVVDALAERP